MTQKTMTKDELFLIKLYQIAQTLGSPWEEVDRYKVGQAIGQNDRSVDNIVNILAKTHFIKKGEGNAIYLTEQGKSLIDLLQDA
jgi:Mn-dependent DtxR family transcriptional regulator